MGTLRGASVSRAAVRLGWQVSLAVVGVMALSVLFPLLMIIPMRLATEALGSARVLLWVDWFLRPVALFVMGAILGLLGGRGGWLVAVVAASPAVVTTAAAHATPMALLVAAFQLLVAGVAGFVGSWCARRRTLPGRL